MNPFTSLRTERDTWKERARTFAERVTANEVTIARLADELAREAARADRLERMAGRCEEAELRLEQALAYIGCASIAMHPGHSSHQWVSDVAAFLHEAPR